MSPTYCQASFLAGTVHSLVVGKQSAVAEATMLMRPLYRSNTQCFIVGIGLGLVMQDASGKPAKPAGTTLGEHDLLHHCRHGFAPGFRDVHAAKFGTPREKRGVSKIVFPA